MMLAKMENTILEVQDLFVFIPLSKDSQRATLNNFMPKINIIFTQVPYKLTHGTFK